MGKEKNVLIPEKLFVQICQYHIFGVTDVEKMIRKGLEAKIDRFKAHQLYSTYKVSPDPEEKEKARQEYLDVKGVHKDFRW